MALFKCKMCGGDLNITADEKIIECEFCGTTQTIPTSKDENLQGLFNRANILRMKSEFDKAEQLYEKIIEKDETQAEAYWGLILCKYGIEYVEDPETFKRIPTCHRTSFDSIIADEDYKSALNFADSVQRGIYEAEAKEIDRIQKGILELSQKEEHYDVFICYKETDNDGKRTQDSVIANDIYHQLTQEGLKVFYAAITLENKLGSAYEPCIFAALNSAKVMLAIGTKPEHFNAVWVKNEWSRFLKIIQKDRAKLLIPCYRDMDAYELPEEFAHLQAQDMSKIGFINDVVRGIKKVISPDTNEVPAQQTQMIENANGNVKALLERGFMALEDRQWDKAEGFFEQALNFDAKLAEAYLGKLLADYHLENQEKLKDFPNPFDNNNNYKKIIRFGSDKLKSELQEYIRFINERNDAKETESIYTEAKNLMDDKDSEGYEAAVELFDKIINYKDSKELKEICLEKIDECIYTEALGLMNYGDIKSYELAADFFARITDYKDSEELRVQCEENIEELKNKSKEKQEHYCIKNLQTNISAGEFHTVGLKSNGIVVATKYVGEKEHYRGEGDVSLWEDVVAISAGDGHTVGLKSDGTVVACGNNRDGRCDVSSWKNIVAISAGGLHTVGITSDGTIVATGYNEYGQCDVSLWEDVVAISAGGLHTVGLKSDGTVVACGNNRDGRCDVSSWKNIVAISAGMEHTVGLKVDGTVVAYGDNIHGRCNVLLWKDIILPINASTFDEFKTKKKQQQFEIKKQKQYRNAGVCQYCGGSFKGLFTKTCAKCGKKKDY